MQVNRNTGKSLRLSRLLRGPGGRSASFAFDHGMQIGAMPGAEDLAGGVANALKARLDGIILTPGAIERTAHMFNVPERPAIIMRLDQTTMWRIGGFMGYEEGQSRTVSSVEEALRLGADAVLAYFFTCHKDPALETQSVSAAGRFAEDCRKWGMPLVLEPMAARGGRLKTPFDAKVIAMNTRMAVEIGADVIKTDWSGSAESFRAVVRGAADTPILVAGGERTGSDADTLQTVGQILEAGAQGVLFGRQLFQSSDPLRLMSAVRGIIHDEITVKQAIQELPSKKRKC